jgi:DHA2 family multidrug resistance protein
MLHSLTPANPAFQNNLNGLQQYLFETGASADVAAARAYGLLNGILDRQAALWSYIDDFRYLALLCFTCIPIVFMLKKVKAAKGAVSSAH